VASEATGRSEVAPPRGGRSDGLAIAVALRLLSVGPLLILVLLAAAISLMTPNFLTSGNVSNILAQTAVIAIVAMGQQLVILTRGIDLSVGANLALATVIGGLVFRRVDSAPVVIAAMLAAGAAVGAVNGVAYVYGRLPHPFIITLATLSICRGLALEFAVGHTTMRGMPDAVTFIGGNSTFGVPNSFFVVVAVAALVLTLTKAMVWGRWLFAVGGEPEAAREMGIPVNVVLVSTYVICGLFAGVGAVVLAGRTAASSPLYGNLLELDTIAAVIIGGASFLGQRGHLGHALVGAVMIGVIRNALNLLSVDVFFQMIAIGLIIVVAVEADVLRNRLEARARTLQAARTQ
jgi:ribose transport system permease protein